MQPLDWPLLLYYITDGKQLGSSGALLDRIRAAAQAGVDWIQLREKDLPVRELEDWAQRARAAIEGTQTKLLINSRVDLAIACGLDGVHLTGAKHELSASEARVIFAKAGVEPPLIGVSCHSVDEVRLAESHGADFVVFGPIFGKGSEPGVGIDGLQRACAAVPNGSTLKVLALGGVDVANAADCLRAGAAGVAGIRLFQTEDAVRTVGTLRNIGAAARNKKAPL
jgi:thiamine-phosphate pyrophosphorylase